MAELRADLVCEGGGVRGIGLVGAVDVLAKAGYHFPRVAGSSAGAIVAAFVAALQRAGEPLTRLEDMVKAIDYRKFTDHTLLGSVPLLGPLLALATSDGIYKGGYLEDYVAGVLKDLGVRTFGDLRIEAAPGEALAEKYAYALVVTASDLSRRRLARLPWDLPSYGVDPDEFSVAKAVRASAAIPFLFEPVRVKGSTWVDGGLLSDFPIELFDRPDAVSPRWPTFGIRLSAPPGLTPPTRAVRGPLSLGIAALGTLISDQDSAYVNDPCTVRRTIFVPAQGVSPIDFGLTPADVQTLYSGGTGAAQKFLESWDYGAYLSACRPASLYPPAPR
ncbi:patatin-like phospholipase family protein [Tomitella biformata]|uniref:patatin-like phospholipase family protein n=1 Tax=Tomitella biformata TaxID=630403 RepID=UPI000463008B|nr:patatin-like phospholipase family protein [Tomitella biformata]